MSFADPNNPVDPTAAQEATSEEKVGQPQADAAQSQVETSNSEAAAEASDEAPRRRILIGSQRDPAAYLARQHRDWTPVTEKSDQDKPEGKRPGNRGQQRGERQRPPQRADASPAAPAPAVPETPPLSAAMDDTTDGATDLPAPDAMATPETPAAPPRPRRAPTLTPPPASGPVPLPNLRERLSPELEDELSRALGDASFDELMNADVATGSQAALELDSLQTGRVLAVRRDDVFLELGGREQGIVSLRQFDAPPQPGAMVQVVVQRFNPEDGLYELAIPHRAVQVDDWSDLVEGALIEVQVTGHNTGGLECEIHHIRGFIPVSQIALYRVEDLAQFVGQRMVCAITEANPERRNLVLSRRAVLEREREQSRQQLLASLQPGQLHEGIVRKLMDFGAFVDLGGVDGLVHISQLAWGRVKHPGDVLQEGQKIQVRVERVDPETGKISLGYRDLMQSPWEGVALKYPPNTQARGTVTKLMDFGAFVELEPGVEGLVHISELSPKRVWRTSDVVHEGDQVDVLVLSVDTESQRISLSMRALAAPPEPVKKDDEAEEDAAAKPASKPRKPQGPLAGGLGRASNNPFGLKW